MAKCGHHLMIQFLLRTAVNCSISSILSRELLSEDQLDHKNRIWLSFLLEVLPSPRYSHNVSTDILKHITDYLYGKTIRTIFKVYSYLLTQVPIQ